VKESEFREKMMRAFSTPEQFKWVADRAVSLAHEAGVTFDPERVDLAGLRLAPLAIMGHWLKILVDASNLHRDLTYAELVEVLRRCKAVDRAIELAKIQPGTGAIAVMADSDLAANRAAQIEDIRAILEGTDA
jgi:hypothetical protein